MATSDNITALVSLKPYDIVRKLQHNIITGVTMLAHGAISTNFSVNSFMVSLWSLMTLQLINVMANIIFSKS